MKCPYCEYTDWDFEKPKGEMEGKHGEFYKLPIDMKRSCNWRTDEVSLHGCPDPECGKVFLNV